MNTKTAVLFGRLMRHILRSPDTIITVAVVPIMLLLLFTYVLGGSLVNSIQMHGATEVNYVNYQLPGILLMTIASGITYTALRLFEDTQKGIFARFNTLPIKRSSALWAHVLTSLVSNMLTLVLIVLLAFLLGFRSDAGVLGWLAAAGMLMLFVLTLTWVAVIPGLTAKTMEGATAFSYPLIFLPFISSAFVPTETMPAAVRAFAEHQPVTSLVETVRALLNAEPAGKNIWIALAWCLGTLVVTYVMAMRTYRYKVA